MRVDRRSGLGVLVLITLLAAAAPATAQEVGQPAPTFTALDVDGTPVGLERFHGRQHVVLVFYVGHT